MGKVAILVEVIDEPEAYTEEELFESVNDSQPNEGPMIRYTKKFIFHSYSPR